MSSRYLVKQRPRETRPGADYIDDIVRDGIHVAVFAHTYRGDEPRLELDGGRMVETGWLLHDDMSGRCELNGDGVALLERALQP